MNWRNVKLIMFREVRDQLRDRRTLFMIAVLPLLLYPLLGTSLFQMAQFVREKTTRVIVIGSGTLEGVPRLIDGEQFDEAWFHEPGQAHLLQVRVKDAPPGEGRRLLAEARAEVEQGNFEAVVFFPPDFADQLGGLRRQLKLHTDREVDAGAEDEPRVPNPEVYFNTANEKSQITFLRVSQVLAAWTEAIGKQNLATSNLPEAAARPFSVAEHDVATKGHRDAAMWSKVLPFMLLIWALTGAFYPAVDLCAGEKERGTLETLLSSPAERSEIVWGKLLTIMLFSIATAVLNLLSMGFTGSIVLSQLPQFGPPPPLAPLWLLLALLPMSALFSALCLALATLARSSKEGQYYLMPLVLVTMPLVILPMAPGVELTLGNSLIPVTGVVLLLRAMLEGSYLEAVRFAPPVVAMTLACCLFAIRWAVDQFNKENVLFRDSERLDLGLWMRHLVADRTETPSAPEGLFCGVLILLIQFFLSMALRQQAGPGNITKMALMVQLVAVLTPTLLMAVMLTRRPLRTLLIRRCNWLALPAAAALALFLHPVANLLQHLVLKLYPVNEDVMQQLSGMFQGMTLGHKILLVAVVPPICEELAFRGFILSGLRHLGHKWQAIILSSVFFGLAHAVFQQSLVACVLGTIIGYMAVQTGSVFPCMVFHVTHNALAVLSGRWAEGSVPEWSNSIFQTARDGDVTYSWWVVALGTALAGGILWWVRSLPYARTAEERLEEAIAHHEPSPSMDASETEQASEAAAIGAVGVLSGTSPENSR